MGGVRVRVPAEGRTVRTRAVPHAHRLADNDCELASAFHPPSGLLPACLLPASRCLLLCLPACLHAFMRSYLRCMRA